MDTGPTVCHATMPFLPQGSWKDLVTTGVLGAASSEIVRSTVHDGKVPSTFSKPRGVKVALLDIAALVVIANNMGMLDKSAMERIWRYLLASNIAVMGPYIVLTPSTYPCQRHRACPTRGQDTAGVVRLRFRRVCQYHTELEVGHGLYTTAP